MLFLFFLNFTCKVQRGLMNYRLQNCNLDINYYKINGLVYSIKKVTKMITSTLRNKCTLQMTEQDHFFFLPTCIFWDCL